MLGLGWAATPAGLQAMEELAKLQTQAPAYKKESSVLTSSPIKRTGSSASNAMCTFLILNMSSLQLIPINMIAYRSQYGSVSPAAIVMPALMATTVSTIVGIFFAKWLEKIWPSR